jgi:hypothetical protein
MRIRPRCCERIRDVSVSTSKFKFIITDHPAGWRTGIMFKRLQSGISPMNPKRVFVSSGTSVAECFKSCRQDRSCYSVTTHWSNATGKVGVIGCLFGNLNSVQDENKGRKCNDCQTYVKGKLKSTPEFQRKIKRDRVL